MVRPIPQGVLPPAKKSRGDETSEFTESEKYGRSVRFPLTSNAFPFLIVRKPNAAHSHPPLLQSRPPQANPSHGPTPPHRESTGHHRNRSDPNPGRGQSPHRQPHPSYTMVSPFPLVNIIIPHLFHILKRTTLILLDRHLQLSPLRQGLGCIPSLGKAGKCTRIKPISLRLQ